MSTTLADDDDELAPMRASAFAIFAYLWRRWRSRPALLSAFLVLYCLGVACDLALPVLSGRLVEALADGPAAAERVDSAYWLFAAVAFGFYFLRNTSVRFWIPFAARNMKEIVTDGFRDVQRFSADWHANNFAGATVRRVSRAMWAYDTISDTIVWFVLPGLAVLFGVTAMTAVRWPAIGAFVFITVVLMFALNYWAARYYLREDYAASNAADTAIGAALADAVGASASVKSFGAEAREEARFSNIVEHWRRVSERLWLRSTNAWIGQNLLLFILQAGLLGLVVHEWRQGRASAGDAAFAISAFFLVSGYLRSLGENIRNIQKGFADISDVAAYARTVEEVRDPADRAPFSPGAGRIEFDRVSFGYRNQESRLYENFSLSIEPGETVALVGPTGSGKSTFVKLVQRLYDVQDGAIKIDGQDVRAVTQASLRAAIALVPQDPALFHRTLRENIAYARPDASREEVMEAACKARAHEFIMRLPQGYDTEVGERGVKLSGGERQRVALARAFLADAPILILDEATSSLDVQTEKDVQAAMDAFKSMGRTMVVIAHRLSTVRAADRILVFDRGRIIEQGGHDALVEAGGLYARLYALSQGDVFGEAA